MDDFGRDEQPPAGAGSGQGYVKVMLTILAVVAVLFLVNEFSEKSAEVSRATDRARELREAPLPDY